MADPDPYDEYEPASRRDLLVAAVVAVGVAVLLLLAAGGGAGVIWARRHPAQWQRVRSFVVDWWVPLSLAVLGLLVLLLVLLIRRLLRPPQATRHGQASQGWATAVSSLAAAVTVIVAVVAVLADNTARRGERELTQQGQLTGRFSTAIDQMGRGGAGNLTARLGGVYALERIMKESPQDQPAIVATLLAFIRDNVPLSKCGDETPEQNRVGDHPTVDVQAALTVVGNRDVRNDQQQVRLDLRNSCLLGAELQGLHYDGVDLTWTDLTCAKLSGARLAKARMVNVSMGHADLRDADLTGARFDHAVMNDVLLQGANLRGATFTNKTDLRRAAVTTEQLAKATVGPDTIRDGSMPPSPECPI